MAALIFVLFTPISFWESFDRVLFGTGIILLILVLVPGIGTEVNGASRWIRVGGFSLQPSEIMKFISILYISGYSVRRLGELQNKFSGFLKPASLIVLVTFLILLQPDLGSSAVLFMTVLGILFIAGVPLIWFFSDPWFLIHCYFFINLFCAMEMGKNNKFYGSLGKSI